MIGVTVITAVSEVYVAYFPFRFRMGKLEGRVPLGRRKRRWVGCIKMDFTVIGRFGMDWIDLA
jgi:hypothetical protein